MEISELLMSFKRVNLFCAVMVITFSGLIYPAINSFSIVTNVPDELDINPFYKKYLDCDGLPVIGSERVDDKAFCRVQELLDKIFKNRPDLREAMVREGCRYIIIAGGKSISCGEENLLSLPYDRYEGESIFIHELAHAIHLYGLKHCEPDFQSRLDKLYQKAMAKGLYKDDYAATNDKEYWAESVQAFFDCDSQNNHVHNHVNTREELIEYDPDMAALIHEVFRITEETDWRYQRYTDDLLVQITLPTVKVHQKYPKYVWCTGFLIFGTGDTEDVLLLEAAEVVRQVFQRRYDILKSLVDMNVSVYISTKDDMAYSLNSHSILLPVNAGQTHIDRPKLICELIRTTYKIVGIRPVGSETISLTEKQVRQIPERMDERFDQKVKQVYRTAMERGLWKTTPAALDRFEYISCGGAAYFNAGQIAINSDQIIKTREQLKCYDPELEKLMAGLFQGKQ